MDALARLIVAAFAVLALAAVAGAAPPGYQAARAGVLADGRAVSALLAAGDTDALVARFAPEFAQQVPREEVERILRETLAHAPLGAVLGQSALPAGPDRRIYLADRRWGAQTIGLAVGLDRDDRITTLALQPREALPPDPHAGRRPRARLRLPFRGEWWVFWGGPTERQNYHVRAPDQRHAYDFLVWRGGGTHRGAGTRNADYWAWGRPILAPAGGVVAAAVDGIRDNRPQVEVENPRAPAGNHVVLDLGGGEYALLAHMQRGSVRVRKGQRVRAGDVLGLCGNSGHTSEPHLHFHLQDRARLFGGARGLPVRFAGRGTPVQGQFVSG